MYQAVPSYKRPIASLIGILFLGLSFSAQASITSELYVEAYSKAETTTDSNTNGPSTDSASTYSSTYSGSNYASTNAFGTNYADGSTSYAARAYGNGIFEGWSSFKKTLTIVNDSLFSQSYNLSYYIYGGSLSVGGWGYTHASGDTGLASVAYSISDGATNLLMRKASVSLASDGSYITDVAGLTAHDDSMGAIWTETEYNTIDLGVLAAGQSKTITYELISTALGNYTLGSGCGGGWGTALASSDDNMEIETLSFSECGYGGASSAGLGDPDGVTSGPQLMTVSSQQVNTVPLPGTLSLFGVALVGLGMSRRWRPGA